MRIKQLINNNKHLLPKFSYEISSGVHGVVFFISYDKIIKISSLSSIKNVFAFVADQNYLQDLYSFLQKENFDIFAKIYDFGFCNDLQYVILEKLNTISRDEFCIFESVISHNDNCDKKDLTKTKSILSEVDGYLTFDQQKILSFVDKIISLQEKGIEHLDLHSRNIMKDNDGNFKLIDLESVEVKQIIWK